MCRSSKFVMLSKLPIEEGNEPSNFIEEEVRLISFTLPKVADPVRESHFIPERSKYQYYDLSVDCTSVETFDWSSARIT